MKQSNFYTIIDGSGNRTNVIFNAENLKEAVKIAKLMHPNLCHYGKVKRIYNGGVRG